MDGNIEFFEKAFTVWETFPRAIIEPFEMTEDGKLYGKLLEVSEIEGDAAYEIMGNGQCQAKLPIPASPVRYDPFFLRQGAVYRIILHLRMDRVPQGVVIDIDLWTGLKPGMILLSSAIDADGTVMLYVMPTLRTKAVRGFPIATLAFRAVAENVLDRSGYKPPKLGPSKAAVKKGSKATVKAPVEAPAEAVKA